MGKRTQDYQGDSTAKLTDGLVDGHIHTEQRTRVLSGPEGEYLQYLMFLGCPEGLNEPLYQEIAGIHMRLMISHEGKSREEFVLGLGRIFDRDQGEYLGYQYQVIADGMQELKGKGKGKDVNPR